MNDDRPLILCRPDRVGDAIIATSLFEAIRQQRPEQQIIFAAREVMRPLVAEHPLLTDFIAIPQPAAPQKRDARRSLTEEFRRWDAGAFVALQPDPISQRAAISAGIPRRIGYRSRLFLDWTLTDILPDRRNDGTKHEAEYNFDLLAPLGINPRNVGRLRPSVELPDSWRRALEVKLGAAGWAEFGTAESGPYAVVNPAAFSQDLRWPADHFAWLIRELLDSAIVERVVVVGDNVNDPSAQRIRYELGPFPGVIDLSGATNLAELGWLLRFARVLVSRNTGTTHLAAAVGCPTVEIFGRTEPRYGPVRWRALGAHNRLLTPPRMRQGFFESRRAFWQRGHSVVKREDVLAAARSVVETHRDSTFQRVETKYFAHPVRRFVPDRVNQRGRLRSRANLAVSNGKSGAGGHRSSRRGPGESPSHRAGPEKLGG